MYSMTAVITATIISSTQNSMDPMITVLLLYSRLLKAGQGSHQKAVLTVYYLE